MNGRLPDFIVIGAMKCGTSALHDQLALRSGIFMSEPKEPNFFSDDLQYARGIRWYRSLFAGARTDQICGESSTHYTKWPSYPHTVERMRELLPEGRFVYVVRDPIERIVSQYVHEWTQREVGGSFERAVRRFDRYAFYSSYATQLEAYLRVWPRSAVLVVAYERLVSAPGDELARICRFLGDPSPEPPAWRPDRGARNVSAERLRKSASRERLLGVPLLRSIKDALPERLREAAKRPWRMPRRPQLSAATRRELEARLDPELERLGRWLGRDLSCRAWTREVMRGPLDWAGEPVPRVARTASEG